MRRTVIQGLIAAVFFVLGGWCLIAPTHMASLVFRPEYRLDHPIVPIIIGCFGAQAMISGLFAAFARFTKATFLAYAIGVLPFFWFNYHFYFVEPVFTKLIFLDAIGNVVFLVLCVYGYLTVDEPARTGAPAPTAAQMD